MPYISYLMFASFFFVVLHTFKYSMDCILLYYIQNLIDNNHLFFHCQQLDKMNSINTIGIY